jgi:hypothetical protein
MGKYFAAVFICLFIIYPAKAGSNLTFYGMSDASAGAAVDSNSFIAADDEENILKVYKIENGTKPLYGFDMSGFLEVTEEFPEADIEAAAKVGNRIYWITSHGRNKDGKLRSGRYRFFATELSEDANRIKPVGKPYKDLAFDFVETKSDVQEDLIEATGFGFRLKGVDRAKLAPKDEGLNIEGLCASADGKTLYIGLRNPLHKKGKKELAIVIPLKNPALVIEKGQKCVFGKPLLWNLDGLGIRDMAYSPFHKAVFIIAGASKEKGGFALYRWTGQENKPPQLVRKIKEDGVKFTPEAIIPFEKSDKLLLLSDDGTIEVSVSSPEDCKEALTPGGKCLNKFLTNPDKKSFRAIWIKP